VKFQQTLFCGNYHIFKVVHLKKVIINFINRSITMNQLNLKGVITSLMRRMMGLGLFITAAFMFTWTASAQPYLDNGGNPDLWYAETFRDALPAHNAFLRQEICVQFAGAFGTHRRYRWWSLTYPGWGGQGTQEGDQVMMYGLWAEQKWNDAWYLEITTEDSPNSILQGGGHWWIWNFGSQTNHYLNLVMTRKAVDECPNLQDVELNQPHPNIPEELLSPK
jgi:hypothetical protein